MPLFLRKEPFIAAILLNFLTEYTKLKGLMKTIMEEPEIKAQREKCPDCGGQLQEIRLIDKAHSGVHTSLEYASPEAKKSRWSGMFPVQGKVLAFLCSRCGRIALYGATVSAE